MTATTLSIFSCCSDDAGIIKLWNIKDNELVRTLEGHGERCWALTTCKDTQDRMVSGCSAGTIIVWKVGMSFVEWSCGTLLLIFFK